MKHDFTAINLASSRYLALNSNSPWSQGIHDEHSNAVVYHHDDGSSHVRRLVVDYEHSILFVSIHDRGSKTPPTLFYRPNSDIVVLGRFFESPHLYRRFGFKECRFRTPFPVPALKKEKPKDIDFAPSSAPTPSLSEAKDEVYGGSLAPSSVPPPSLSVNTEELSESSVAPSSAPPSSFTSSTAEASGISLAPSSVPPPSLSVNAEEASDSSVAASSALSSSFTSSTARESGISLAPSSAPPSSLIADTEEESSSSTINTEAGTKFSESIRLASEGKSHTKHGPYSGVRFFRTVTTRPSSQCASSSHDGCDFSEVGNAQDTRDAKPPVPFVRLPREANKSKSGKSVKFRDTVSEIEVFSEAGSGSEKGKSNSINDEGGGYSCIRFLVDKRVQKELEKIDLNELKCFALTPDGKGIVYVEKDGVCHWTGKIGRNLAKLLDSSTKSVHAVAINLGSHGRYFVRFLDGKVAVNGNEKLFGMVDKGDVKMVAFGKRFDSYAIIYRDGSTSWENVPRRLRKILERCDGEGAKAEFVSIGVDGDYFVRQAKEKKTSSDGKKRSVETTARYGNIHSDQLLKLLEKWPHDIRQVAFGAGGTFVATH